MRTYINGLRKDVRSWTYHGGSCSLLTIFHPLECKRSFASRSVIPSTVDCKVDKMSSLWSWEYLSKSSDCCVCRLCRGRNMEVLLGVKAILSVIPNKCKL